MWFCFIVYFSTKRSRKSPAWDKFVIWLTTNHLRIHRGWIKSIGDSATGLTPMDFTNPLWMRPAESPMDFIHPLWICRGSAANHLTYIQDSQVNWDKFPNRDNVYTLYWYYIKLFELEFLTTDERVYLQGFPLKLK